MNEQFTQGDWCIDSSYSTMLNVTVNHSKNSSTGVCEVDCSWVWDEHNEYKSEPTYEELANASLIAAAPKMYRLLNALKDFNCPFDYMTADEMIAFTNIEKLLAEARGESKDTD